MDYKYINQLLERYWRCETTLEEENILRAFFSQDNVPVELLPYRALFSYEQNETKEDVLGEDFDERVLARVEAKQTVKARVISMPQRLRPLFKAAAVVAIVLTLGNAMQVPYERKADPIGQYDGYDNPMKLQQGNSVALSDSSSSAGTTDSMRHSMVEPQDMTGDNIIK
ncbi:MAG: pyruvate ferredoxin oxidoreductase [Prevotella sp.]|jgi:hypothetical protein